MIFSSPLGNSDSCRADALNIIVDSTPYEKVKERTTYARTYCNLNLVKGVNKFLVLIVICSSKDSPSSDCSCLYRASSSDSSLCAILAIQQGGCCGSPEEYMQKVVLPTLNRDNDYSLVFIGVEDAML
jgi:hypothetical protein